LRERAQVAFSTSLSRARRLAREISPARPAVESDSLPEEPRADPEELARRLVLVCKDCNQEYDCNAEAVGCPVSTRDEEDEGDCDERQENDERPPRSPEVNRAFERAHPPCEREDCTPHRCKGDG